MGARVQAICKCGLNKSLAVGGSRMNFLKVEYFPCLCNTCNDIVEGNIKNKKPNCPKCYSSGLIPYNNKTLIGAIGDSIVERSFDNILTNGKYKCPRCNQMCLEFELPGILWD